jgi:hypothetical protein
MNHPIANEIKALGDAHALGLEPEAQRYWHENGRRIASNLAVVQALCDQHSIQRVLDIGPSFQTIILKGLVPHIELETMGWNDHRFRPGADTVHHTIDLNQTAQPDACATPAPVDLVLFLEVIEHLHTSPRHVLRYLWRCLNAGGFLVLSTPNAAFLRNRLDMLFGVNPFEHIREDSLNPGHFREYTRSELVNYSNSCGFDVVDARVDNLFAYGPGSGRLFSRISEWLPMDFRRDITVVAQKQKVGQLHAHNPGK